MASLRKRPKSDYWVCCYTLPDGSRTQRSTGCKDKGEAFAVCQAWEAEAKAQREAQPVLTGKRKRMLAVAALFAVLVGVGLWFQFQPEKNPALFVDLDSENAPDTFQEISVAKRFRWVTLDEQALKELSRPGAEVDLNLFPDEKHTVWIVGNQAHDKDFDTSTGLIERDTETMVILSKGKDLLRGFVTTRDAKQFLISYGGPTKDGRQHAFAVVEVEPTKVKACGVIEGKPPPGHVEPEVQGETEVVASGDSGDQRAFHRHLKKVSKDGKSPVGAACLACAEQETRGEKVSLREARKFASSLNRSPVLAANSFSLLGRQGGGMGRSAHPAAAVNVLYPRPAAGPNKTDWIDIYFLLSNGCPDPAATDTQLYMNMMITQQNAIFARSQVPLEVRWVGLDRAQARWWSGDNVPPGYGTGGYIHVPGEGPITYAGNTHYGGVKPAWITNTPPQQPTRGTGLGAVMGIFTPAISNYVATTDMGDGLDWLTGAAGMNWGPFVLGLGSGYRGNSQIYGDQYWGTNTIWANHHPDRQWGLMPNYSDDGYGAFVTLQFHTNGTTNWWTPQDMFASNPRGPIATNGTASVGWQDMPLAETTNQIGYRGNGLVGVPPWTWQAQYYNADIFTGLTMDPSPYASLYNGENGGGRGRPLLATNSEVLPYVFDYDPLGTTNVVVFGTTNGVAKWYTDRTRRTGANPATIFNHGTGEIDINKSAGVTGHARVFVIPGWTKMAFTGAAGGNTTLPSPLMFHQDYWLGKPNNTEQRTQLVITGGGPGDQFRSWLTPIAPTGTQPDTVVWPHAVTPTDVANNRFSTENEYSRFFPNRRSNAGKIGFWESAYRITGDRNTTTVDPGLGLDQRDNFGLKINGFDVGVHQRVYEITGDAGGGTADNYVIDINGTTIGEQRSRFTIIGDATTDSDKYEVKIIDHAGNSRLIGYQRDKYVIDHLPGQDPTTFRFVPGFLAPKGGDFPIGLGGNQTANVSSVYRNAWTSGYFLNPLPGRPQQVNGSNFPVGAWETNGSVPWPPTIPTAPVALRGWPRGNSNASMAWAIKMAVDQNLTTNEYDNGVNRRPFVRTEVSTNLRDMFTIEGFTGDSFTVELNVTAPTQANPGRSVVLTLPSGNIPWTGSNASTAAAIKSAILGDSTMSQWVDVNVTSSSQTIQYTIIGDTNGTANGMAANGASVFGGTDYYIVTLNGVSSVIPFAFAQNGAGGAAADNNWDGDGGGRSNATAALNIKTFIENNSTLNQGLLGTINRAANPTDGEQNVLTFSPKAPASTPIDLTITAVDFNDFNYTTQISGDAGDSFSFTLVDNTGNVNAVPPNQGFNLAPVPWTSNNATTAIALKNAIDANVNMSPLVNTVVTSDQNSTFTIVGDANGTVADTFGVTITGMKADFTPITWTRTGIPFSTYTPLNFRPNNVNYPPNNATFAKYIRALIHGDPGNTLGAGAIAANATIASLVRCEVSQNPSGEDANISFTPAAPGNSFTVNFTTPANVTNGGTPAENRGGNGYAPSAVATHTGKDANLTVYTKPGAWVNFAAVGATESAPVGTPAFPVTSYRFGQTYPAYAPVSGAGPEGIVIVTPKTPTTWIYDVNITANSNGDAFVPASNPVRTGTDANVTFISARPGQLFESRLWRRVGTGGAMVNRPKSPVGNRVVHPVDWSTNNETTAKKIVDAVNRNADINTFVTASTTLDPATGMNDNTVTLVAALPHRYPFDGNITTGDMNLTSPSNNYGLLSTMAPATGIVCDPGNGVGGNQIPSANWTDATGGIPWVTSNQATALSIARAIDANGTTGNIVSASTLSQGGKDYLVITSLIGGWLVPVTTTANNNGRLPVASLSEDTNSTTAAFRYHIDSQYMARQVASAINVNTDVNGTVTAWPSAVAYPGLTATAPENWDPSVKQPLNLVVRSDIPGTPMTNSPAFTNWSVAPHPVGKTMASFAHDNVYPNGRHTGSWASQAGTLAGTNIWHIPWTDSNENTAQLICTAINNTPYINSNLVATISGNTVTITGSGGNPFVLHGPYLVNQNGGAAPNYTRNDVSTSIAWWRLYETRADALDGNSNNIMFDAFTANTTYTNRTWTFYPGTHTADLKIPGGIRMDRGTAPNPGLRRYPGLHDNTGPNAEPDLICLFVPAGSDPQRAGVAMKPPRAMRAPSGVARRKDETYDHNQTAIEFGDLNLHGFVVEYGIGPVNYTFAHELGHALGASHAIGDVNAGAPAGTLGLAVNDPSLSFSAWVDTWTHGGTGSDSFTSVGTKIVGVDNKFYNTIMSYPRSLTATNFWATNKFNMSGMIPYYSNPWVFYRGRRLSDRYKANNARCVTEYGRVVASYRDANNTSRQKSNISVPSIPPVGTPNGFPQWTSPGPPPQQQPPQQPAPPAVVAPAIAAPVVAVAPSVAPGGAVPATSPTSGFRRAPWGVTGGIRRPSPRPNPFTTIAGRANPVTGAGRRVMVLNPIFGDVAVRGNPTQVAHADGPGRARPGGGLATAPSGGGGLPTAPTTPRPGGGGLPTTPVVPPRPGGGGLNPGLPPSPPTPPPARPNPNLPNDNFGNPIALLPLPGSPELVAGTPNSPAAQWYFNGHNLGATPGAGENSTVNPLFGGRSVWFQWPPNNQNLALPPGTQVEIDTRGSNFDTVLMVKNNATGARAPSDNVPNATWSRVTMQVGTGQPLLIMVDGRNGATGQIRLNLRLIAP